MLNQVQLTKQAPGWARSSQDPLRAQTPAGARSTISHVPAGPDPSHAEAPSPEEAIPDDSVREQLERILSSSCFVKSERLSRFLRFVTLEKIAGRSSELKEYSIGTQVYDRGDTFDPTVDTIVRVEARRLRATLERYYATEGSSDSVRIEVPKGGYEPKFKRSQFVPNPRQSDAGSAIVVVLPFKDLGPDADQDFLCAGIREEIINALTQLEGLRVAAGTTPFPLPQPGQDARRVSETLHVGTLVGGSVRRQADRLRITAQLIDLSSGCHLWSRRFDHEMNNIFAIQDEVAGAVAQVVRIRLRLPGPRSLHSALH